MSKKPVDNYGDSSISSLKGADQVRKKPANIFGSTDVWGAFHSVVEILANSFDEKRALVKINGHDRYDTTLPYKYLYVACDEDKVLTVLDKGRGVPMAFNPDPQERKFNWHMVFCLLYAGGKYADEEDGENSNYSESLGTNGLGGTATQYASKFFNVESKRDGKLFKAFFEQGKPMAHYLHNGQMVRIALDMDFKERYYVGAELPAKTMDGKSTTVVLEDFEPYALDSGYEVDRETAQRLGLVPQTRKEQHPNYISLNMASTEDELVDNIYDKLYHTVLVASPLEEEHKNETGTTIKWQIDNEVFYDTNYTALMFDELLETQAHVGSTLIEFNDAFHGRGTINFRGVSSEHYFKERIGEETILATYDMEKTKKGVEANKKYNAKARVVVALTDGTVRKDLHLHNTGLMTDGVHLLYANHALEQFFTKVSKQYGIAIKPHEYEPYFSFMTETYANANATSFKNQTKKGITNTFIGSMISDAIQELLEDAYVKQKQELMDIITIATTMARDRINSAEEKKKANLVKKTLSKRHTVVKLSEAKSEKAEECEFTIVEGDSAKSSVNSGRDSRTQAVYPVRGKVPNALKRPLEKLLENENIKDIISAIGVGVDVGNTTHGVYNYNKRRYDKIIIMTDADKDGFQIRVLLFLIFYVLMPELITKGHVYIVEAPFIRLMTSKGKFFAYTLEERDEMLKEFSQQGITVKSQVRIKGLGGLKADEIRDTIMNVENRRMIQLNMDIADEATKGTIDTLFGMDARGLRKDVILKAIGVSLQSEERAILEDTVDEILEDIDSTVVEEDFEVVE